MGQEGQGDLGGAEPPSHLGKPLCHYGHPGNGSRLLGLASPERGSSVLGSRVFCQAGIHLFWARAVVSIYGCFK